MAYTTINKSTDNFNTKLWAGNGTSQALTGVGHQTDMAWIKSRTDTRKHNLYDVVRGVQKRLVPNDTPAEDTVPGVTAFGTDGFTVGSETDTNGSSRNFVGWSWKAGGGQGSSNTDGSINTTYTSVNTTAGFSICKWTGNATNSTIGHGLGAVPKMIIIKRLTGGTTQWVVYHVGTGNTQACYLNTTATPTDVIGFFNDTTPTSSVFTVGTDTAVNGSGNEMIAYCFAEKKGYSKFGSYTGNGNVDGTFVYTGFRPNFVMCKYTGVENWAICDDKRLGYNVANYQLYANATNADVSNVRMDILSNGFKCRTTNAEWNGSGNIYIYMAFGQTLVSSNNIPGTAR